MVRTLYHFPKCSCVVALYKPFDAPGSILQHTGINLCHLGRMLDRDSQEIFVFQVPTFSQVGFWPISK